MKTALIMDTPASTNWYQANFQYLQTAVTQVRQVLEETINLSQNQTSPLRVETTLTPDAFAPLQNKPSALDALCSTFKVSSFERYILLLCVGMELDRKFEVLCSKFHGHQEQNYPTLHLAFATFNEAHLSAFSSESTLQYWQLIEFTYGQTLSHSALRINRRPSTSM